MDAFALEALADARSALDELPDVPEAKHLRLRREIVERAALKANWTDAPAEHLAMLGRLADEVRHAANELRVAHRVVMQALAEAMD